jgi:hypothetical protein
VSPLFDRIESAREYVGLLLDEAITEAAEEIDGLRRAAGYTSSQRGDALLLIAYKLEQLRVHIDASYRRLDDLRALHRALEHGSTVTPAA